jgi:PPOX class probable F420-dependent enzyme
MPPSQQELWDLIANRQNGILATISQDGTPQMSNVLYVPDVDTRVIRISTTAARFKSRNLERDPRAALHVAGDDFWQYAVARGTVTLSDVATARRDPATEELFAVHTAFYGRLERDAFDDDMINNTRRVIWLHPERLYGVIANAGRRPVTDRT